VIPPVEGFDALLESVAVEPHDETEMMAKFAIYETYLETVVAIRDQTIDFWLTNQDQFEGAAKATCAKAIKDIDTVDSMSIHDTSTRWFVYDMMKKANQNNTAITRVLASIRSKLEMLAQEDLECPFCLETIVAENNMTLGCCHRSCKTCWDNWQQMKGARAFCPLCRHEEFVQELFT
jgi:dihydroxyacetone kinase-like predicted kinase